MQTQVPLEKVVMAVTCLLSSQQYGQLPVYINSQQSQTVNHASSGCSAKERDINMFINTAKRFNDVELRYLRRVEQIQNDIEELMRNTKASSQPPKGFCEDRPDGAINITVPAGSDPIEVICESNKYGKNWMMISRRVAGSDAMPEGGLENGFRAANGEFFIGMKRLYALSESHLQEKLMVTVDIRGVEHFDIFRSFGITDDFIINHLGTHITDRLTSAKAETIEYKLQMSDVSIKTVKVYLRPTSLEAIHKAGKTQHRLVK